MTVKFLVSEGGRAVDFKRVVRKGRETRQRECVLPGASCRRQVGPLRSRQPASRNDACIGKEIPWGSGRLSSSSFPC